MGATHIFVLVWGMVGLVFAYVLGCRLMLKEGARRERRRLAELKLDGDHEFYKLMVQEQSDILIERRAKVQELREKADRYWR